MNAQNYNWSVVEDYLAEVFEGKLRKNGSPMKEHSLRIGRALLSDGRDAITVFGGYCHDVTEDTDDDTLDIIAFAVKFFGDQKAALIAGDLVEECSYTEDEYKLPKPERKKAAVARWSATEDIRVAYVKKADVEDNRADCARVSPEFEEAYLSWAQPLHDNLVVVIERLVADQYMAAGYNFHHPV